MHAHASSAREERRSEEVGDFATGMAALDAAAVPHGPKSELKVDTPLSSPGQVFRESNCDIDRGRVSLPDSCPPPAISRGDLEGLTDRHAVDTHVDDVEGGALARAQPSADRERIQRVGARRATNVRPESFRAASTEQLPSTMVDSTTRASSLVNHEALPARSDGLSAKVSASIVRKCGASRREAPGFSTDEDLAFVNDRAFRVAALLSVATTLFNKRPAGVARKASHTAVCIDRIRAGLDVQRFACAK